MTQKVVSLPKRRRRHWWRNLLATLASALLAWGLYLLVTAPWWQVGDIRIFGAQPAKAAIIRQAIVHMDVLGTPLWRVDPQLVEQVVNGHDWVHQSEVRRWLFPARLDVYLRARVGWARLVWQGKIHTIDEDGVKVQDVPQIPLLFQIDRQRPTPHQLTCMRQLVEAWRLRHLDGHGTYQVANPQKIIWLTGQETVWLGTAEQLPAKIAAYHKLKPLAKAKGKRLEYIDLRWWQNPVLKVRS